MVLGVSKVSGKVCLVCAAGSGELKVSDTLLVPYSTLPWFSSSLSHLMTALFGPTFSDLTLEMGQSEALAKYSEAPFPKKMVITRIKILMTARSMYFVLFWKEPKFIFFFIT